MMRKNLLTALCIMCFPALCLLVSPLTAQLSGTKVIGTAPSDYTSFTAAVSALTSQGISNSVVFEVKPGTYNERITIGAISGVSATKTITFRSQNLDTASVTLSYASSGSGTNNYVLFLDGADYITFDYITIHRTGTDNYAQVIDISNGATHNTFQNCRIRGTTAASTTLFTVLVGSTNTLEDSYNSFVNNNFEGGSYGLYFLGRGSTMLDPGLVVNNNRFLNQNFKGIYITYMDDPQITSNTITSVSTNNNFYGIYGQYTNNDTRILKNKLSLGAGYGIYLTNCEAMGGSQLLVANNFVAVTGSTTNYGIYINNVENTNFYYNSVNLTTSTAGRAFYITGATTANNEAMNNILANSGGGYTFYVESTVGTPFLQCDNNDLYSSGSVLAYWKASGNQNTLANWRTASGLDVNSLSVNPNFVSSADLHVQNGALNGQATINLSSQTPVTDDIDGQSRSALHPDIGADEFNVENIGVSSLAMDPDYCQNTTAQIKVYIRNYTAFPFQGSTPVFYQLNGGSVVSASTGNINIPANDSILYMFMTQAFLGIAGNISLVSGTGLSIDTDHNNDTLVNATITVLPAPPADAGYDIYVCLGDSAILQASGGGTYLWNTVPPQSGEEIHVLVTDTSQFIVTVTGSNGCVASDTVMVYPGIYPKPVADFSFAPLDREVTFTDLSTDAYGWDWDFGDGQQSTEQNPVHEYASDGSYNVTLIAYNGCDADTISKSVSVVGISETYWSEQCRLQPNPAGHTVGIVLPSEVNIAAIRVLDMRGKEVITYPADHVLLDISLLDNGLYVVMLETSRGFIRKMLAVQR